MGKDEEENTEGFSEASYIPCDGLHAGYSGVFYHNIVLYVCVRFGCVSVCMLYFDKTINIIKN